MKEIDSSRKTLMTTGKSRMVMTRRSPSSPSSKNRFGCILCCYYILSSFLLLFINVQTIQKTNTFFSCYSVVAASVILLRIETPKRDGRTIPNNFDNKNNIDDGTATNDPVATNSRVLVLKKKLSGRNETSSSHDGMNELLFFNENNNTHKEMIQDDAITDNKDKDELLLDRTKKERNSIYDDNERVKNEDDDVIAIPDISTEESSDLGKRIDTTTNTEKHDEKMSSNTNVGDTAMSSDSGSKNVQKSVEKQRKVDRGDNDKNGITTNGKIAVPFKPMIVAAQSMFGMNFFQSNHRLQPLRKLFHNVISRHNSLPSTKHILGVAAVTTIGYKVVTSEPIRRCCYFWTNAGPIIVHYRFTKWWMRISNVPPTRRHVVFESLHDKYCHKSLRIILQLKGLYTKIGQILSSRPDFMPRQYVELFSQLQDSVPQWPYHDNMENVVRTSLKKECDYRYEDVFEHIDPIAIGSASIGQVHKATLRDDWARRNGRDRQRLVAIKIMHPGAQQRFSNDFQVFRWLCRVTLPGWKGFLDELERQFGTEFDYRKEANSLRQVRHNMARSPYSDSVCVPEPLSELCCKEVLVMELLNGKRLVESIADQLTDAFGGSAEAASEFLALKRKEVITGSNAGSDQFLKSTNLYGKLKLLYLFKKCRDNIQLLVKIHGHQIFINGCWNGDPHSGNFLQLTDGRIGLIDYGQTKRISDTDRIALAKVIVAIADHANDPVEIGTAMKNAGFSILHDDDTMLTKYAKLFFDSDEESVQAGCSTPQAYFAKLMFTNPLVDIPDAAVFVGRASFLFRGFGHAIGTGQIKTSKRWSEHARQALAEVVVK